MLRQRVLTALVLIPLVVAGVLLLPSVWLGLALALVILLGSGEWARLSGIEACLAQIPYILVSALGLYGAAFLLQDPARAAWLLFPAALWWLGLSLLLLAWRRSGLDRNLKGVSYGQLLLGFCTLVPAWGALIYLHSQFEPGPRLLLFLLVLIWVADSGAYFAGKRWGRTKLAPGISPGKTLEGVAGALFGVLLCGLGWSLAMGYAPSTGLSFILLCLLTGAVSVSGDLFESLMKRLRGLKDSGQMLPGHGGVLDRIDSLTAAGPVFAAGLLLLDLG
jgi:phosphatidate cytidylyltransferase